MKKYSDKQVLKILLTLDEWKFYNGKIHKKYIFSNFVSAFQFMKEIAKYAEETNHHPEWCNVFNSIDVHLITHSAKGITDLDFNLARKMNEVALAINSD